MNRVKQQIQELENLNKTKKTLNDKYLNKALLDVGLYEERKELFKPIIEEVSKQTEVIKKVIPKESSTLPSTASKLAIEDVKNNFNNTSDEDKMLLEDVYNFIQNPGKIKGGLDTFTSKFMTNKGEPIFKTNKQSIILTKNADNKIVYHVAHNNKDYEMTDGLNKLLLLTNYIPDDNITPEDFHNYTEIIGEKLNTKKYKAYKKHFKDGQGIFVESKELSKDLNKKLKVLIAAYKEGHNNCYDEIIEILKELLNRKEITSKHYNFILQQL